jgi:hypothetical protein
MSLILVYFFPFFRALRVKNSRFLKRFILKRLLLKLKTPSSGFVFYSP